VLVGDGRWSRHFVDRRRIDVNRMKLCFAYPHQWSNTDDKIKHWCFVLPLDERTTRVFFLFYFAALRIPFTRIAVPRWLMSPLLQISNWLMIRPLLMQDGAMDEAANCRVVRAVQQQLARRSDVLRMDLRPRSGSRHRGDTRQPGARPSPMAPTRGGEPRTAGGAQQCCTRCRWQLEGEVVWCPIITARRHSRHRHAPNHIG
jgi:hypothetical protein